MHSEAPSYSTALKYSSKGFDTILIFRHPFFMNKSNVLWTESTSISATVILFVKALYEIFWRTLNMEYF